MAGSGLRSRVQGLARWVWVRLPGSWRRWLVRRLEPKFLVGVVVLALSEDGRVLCVRHVFRPKAYPWGLPAGFMKPGEGPEAAVLRELLEETGYEAQVEALLEASMVLSDQLELVYRVRLGRTTGHSSFESTASGLFPPGSLPPGFLPSGIDTLRRHGFPLASEANR